MPVWAQADRPGLDGGDWQRVLNTVGGLIASASDAGAERIVAVVTSGHVLAPTIADRVRSLFTIEVGLLSCLEAATLAAVGARARDARARPVAVHLGVDAVAIAGDGAARELPCDLARLRLSLTAHPRARAEGEGGRVAPRRLAAVARLVHDAAAVTIERLHLVPPRTLVMTGPASPWLGQGPIPLATLLLLERDAPTAEARLAAMVAAALAAGLSERAVAVDPAAVRMGVLVREFRARWWARPWRATAQASW